MRFIGSLFLAYLSARLCGEIESIRDNQFRGYPYCLRGSNHVRYFCTSEKSCASSEIRKNNYSIHCEVMRNLMTLIVSLLRHFLSNVLSDSKRYIVQYN